MLWWVISGALFVSGLAGKETSIIIASGIFAIAGSISYIGSVIKMIFDRRGNRDA